MASNEKWVPIQLTYQHIAAMTMCFCGRVFEGFGEEGEREMERAFDEHAATCEAAKNYDKFGGSR